MTVQLQLRGQPNWLSALRDPAYQRHDLAKYSVALGKDRIWRIVPCGRFSRTYLLSMSFTIFGRMLGYPFFTSAFSTLMTNNCRINHS